ncbi:MAG: Rieske (2Fe-2S) protein [Clostridiales bacterium]|jgi:3-phenylpropionate/trans-cinnamate dioxygenase ferredoxin subunit|nr:Rieske (2Fe-2S) protein [Clostridiales bacterium]
MNRWVFAVPLERLGEGEPLRVKADDTQVVMIKVDGVIHAVLNRCPHLGCFMHKGQLSGHLLTCPCHDWVFDIRTGQFTAAPEITIPIFPTKVENGEILIDLGGK